MDNVSEHRATHVEFIDTWATEEKPIACGCVAFHCEGRTLAVYSRSRYSRRGITLSDRPLVAGWQDADAWFLVRQRFRDVANTRCAVGPTVWHEADGQTLLGLHISDCGNSVRLDWSSSGLATQLASAEGWDDAVLLADRPAHEPPSFALAPSGPYAWLHPAARIPVTLAGLHFPSAAPADWPLGAWQMLRGQGCNARLSEHVRSAKLPDAWAALVVRIMWARIQQHPWVRARLPAVPKNVRAEDALAEIALAALPDWRGRQDVAHV